MRNERQTSNVLSHSGTLVSGFPFVGMNMRVYHNLKGNKEVLKKK